MRYFLVLLLSLYALPSIASVPDRDIDRTYSLFTESLFTQVSDCGTPSEPPRLAKPDVLAGKTAYYEGWFERDPFSRFMNLQVALARKRSVIFPPTLSKVLTERNAFSWRNDRVLRNQPIRKYMRWQWADARRAVQATNALGYQLTGKWACVLFYLRSDRKGVSKRSNKWFAKYTRRVGTVGAHDYHCYKDEVQKQQVAHYFAKEKRRLAQAMLAKSLPKRKVKKRKRIKIAKKRKRIKVVKKRKRRYALKKKRKRKVYRKLKQRKKARRYASLKRPKGNFRKKKSRRKYRKGKRRNLYAIGKRGRKVRKKRRTKRKVTRRSKKRRGYKRRRK